MYGSVKFPLLAFFGPRMPHGFQIFAPFISGDMGREQIELYRFKFSAIVFSIRIVPEDSSRYHEVVHFSVWLDGF